MPSFTWFDIVLFLVLLSSIVSGLRAGVARVAVGLVATVAGIVAGFWFYRMVAVQLTPYIGQNIDLANLLGFLLIFSGVLVLGAIVAAILSRLFAWVGLSWFDHLLGGAAGIVRGVLVIAVLVDVIVAFVPAPTQAFLDNSRVLPYTNQLSGWLMDIAPRELKDSFEQQMKGMHVYPGHTRSRSNAAETEI